MTTKPTAHISVGKNRVRKGREVYLKNDTEFEIELYNPTDQLVCAKIWINGIQMQGGALVLNPAQRYHLDRYLDEPKKFKFSTYKVSGSQEEIEQAIKNNGLIQVKFYNEIIPVTQGNPIVTQGNPIVNPSPLFPPYNQNLIWYGGPTTSPYNSYCDTNTFTNNEGHDVVTCNFISTSSTFDSKDLIIEPNLHNELEDSELINNSNTRSADIKESGRIEGGSKSDQSFEYVNKSFAFSPCAEYEYIILPMSRKVIEAKEVGSKIYCTGCKLRKRKPTWKFCPKCGTEFEF